MTTNVPNTVPLTTQTSSGATAPTAYSSDTCQVSIPDYSVLRQQNNSKINDYYNSLLKSYTSTYSDYATQSASVNVNDRTYANTILKPKVADYNTQVINLSQSYINSVNQDTDLIIEQKNDLQKKTAEIDNLMSNIKLLKNKELEVGVLTNSRLDSLNSTKTGAEDMQMMTYIYTGINILLVICIIGLIIYLVSSNYSL